MKEPGSKIQYMADKILESMAQSGQVSQKDMTDFKRVMEEIVQLVSNGVSIEDLPMPTGCDSKVCQLAMVVTESLDEEEPLMREYVKSNPQKVKTQKVGGHRWDDDYYDNYWYNDYWYSYYPNYHYYPYWNQSWYTPYWMNNWSNYYWWPYYGGYNYLGY